MTEDEFWNSTPRETARREWAHVEKLKVRNKEYVTLAWHTAVFMRQRRIASLNTILSSARRLSEAEKKVHQVDHERLVREMGA